ncbi:hypothetical protein SAMN05892883_4384 [Jatrophihabitans sp. GAS493]|uniref:CPBP family intramembrane glutamic endopeptidase n=1 Tax=Jatrophihabitans sp. GAS493 TaxID=1907575 RepID=UPI000BB6D06F|nr:CPBP family intramembrane glutamic endopeptidase [Jatrophihabitans sp. GAS493]SOD75179.1 hypothetical protein SAMN05892883_4384 [Jatrophihabitans sp. GAS493]
MTEKTSAEPASAGSARQRHLSVLGLLALIVVYLLIVQGLGRLVEKKGSAGYAQFTTNAEVVRNLIVPVGISLIFVYAVVAVLGWWRPVFVDDRPVRRWVWVLPAVMVVSILAVINYGGLADKGLSFTLLLLIGTMCVGFAEEGLFRGISVTTFRRNGFSEARVALWSCIIFGLVHASNIFSEGPKALAQVAITAVAGYFFYLTRRVSGGLVVGAILHGLWDFSLVSGSVVAGHTYAGAAVAILADVVMLVIVLLRRHHIEPAATPT